jgi:hypothetical protein
MFLGKYKESGACVSNATNVCTQCGPPVKYRGIVYTIIRLLIIVFLVIPIGIGIFLSVHDLITGNAISTQVPAKPMQDSTLHHQ